jgi:anti-sigma factor ChrR (cupin superfamily)
MNHTTAGDAFTSQASLYALGALGQHEANAFEAHLAQGCTECASELAPFQSVVAALSCATEAEPPAHVRDRLLSQVANSVTRRPTSIDLDFFSVRDGEGQWHQASEGISVKKLFTDPKSGGVTALFKFTPGAHTPRHLHAGIEQCLVLEGDFHLNDETFGPGDFTCAMPGSVHEDAYTEKGALVLIWTNQAA